ncbi:SIR2 family histone deacetylase-like protein [Biscogniauxia mediterranea]|nr:SIR2 family histone deacetylase-like protein [Biscogniauxia mediterranea]
MLTPRMRVPYTGIFSTPAVVPISASTIPGAVAALQQFFAAASPSRPLSNTTVLTGAGISVASGLADYRGPHGVYRTKKIHPVFFNLFMCSHEARQRYWSRSFMGWTTWNKAKPNASHFALRQLGDLGLINHVITQNVDSFHTMAHPDIPTTELHGYLRSCVCMSCHEELPRDAFQDELARLNPAWASFLQKVLASGILDEDISIRNTKARAMGMWVNPDGDLHVEGMSDETFRYPPCPKCLKNPPVLPDGSRAVIRVDADGAFDPTGTAGILKPAVVMFGQNVHQPVKAAAERIIEKTDKLLVLGSSLAAYSSWQLAKRAKDRGIPIAIINIGGVRGESELFGDLNPYQDGRQGVRLDMSTGDVLPALVEKLRQL